MIILYFADMQLSLVCQSGFVSFSKYNKFLLDIIFLLCLKYYTFITYIDILWIS